MIERSTRDLATAHAEEAAPSGAALSDAATAPQAGAPLYLPRRAALLGAGAVGVAAVLAGCSTYGNTTSAPASDPGVPAGTGAAPAGEVLAQTSDIPVGGGKIFSGKDVVVTQPEQGTFKAFSSICTHQGCKVTTVKNGTINCPCHGSKFKVSDGSVDAGPAPKPLATKQVTVDGTSLRLA